MSTGAITWTCLMLAVHAGAPDVTHMNQRGFQIPIRFQQEKRNEIKELILWVSRDEGKSWNEQARTTPDRQAFPFIAPEDGTYWFKVAVVDLRGQQEPRNALEGPVGQKVAVDTVRPEVHITAAERQGPDVVVRWTARDKNPDTASFRVEYRAEAAGSGWTPAAVIPAEQGETRFQAGPGAVAVRVVLKDLAENEGSDTTTVGAGPTPPRPAADRAATSAAPPPLGTFPPEVRAADKPQEPAAPGGPQVATAVAPQNIPPGAGPGPLPVRDLGPPGLPMRPDPGEALRPPAPPAAPTPSVSQASLSTERRGSLPPLRIVNKRQVKLDFDVTRFGPSGLGNVDVYTTLDDGQTWERSPAEANAVLPVAGERAGPVHGSVTVQLNRDGATYGFYLVIKSRAGLGKPPPQRGDPPQVRLEVDTTAPEAKLYLPQPDPAGRVVLTWTASDRNLAPNPVTLEWAERKDGPWQVIGEPQMPNAGGADGITGRYVWQVSEGMAPRVYLKLTVRDTAGNVAVAQTGEPVLIDTHVPVVENVGVGTGE